MDDAVNPDPRELDNLLEEDFHRREAERIAELEATLESEKSSPPPAQTTPILATIQVEAGPIPVRQADVDLFRSVVAPGCTIEEAALVWRYAQQLGLDPIRKQVMLIKPDRNDPENRVILVGIHGMIAVAARSPGYKGFKSATVYPGEEFSMDQDGNVRHVIDPTKRAGEPIGAWATCVNVIAGEPVRFSHWSPFEEVARRKADGQLTRTWRERQDWMAEKNAIASVFRKGFAGPFAGVYAAEEFNFSSSADGAINTERLNEDEDAGHYSAPAQLPGKASQYISGQCNVCGSPLLRLTAKAGYDYSTCELDHRIKLKHDKEALNTLKKMEATNPDMIGKKHYWRRLAKGE